METVLVRRIDSRVNSEIETDNEDLDPPATDESEGRQDSPMPIMHDVVLDVFEGPLDLLLYLIRKNEVNIYDIPIATITAQYLAFLAQGDLRDLEQAADFVLLAATLMKIKSQMLLPRQIQPGEEEGEDPREELVRRLLEYQQFKEVADWLSEQGLEYRDVYPRSGSVADEESGGVRPVSLFDLLKVYKHVIDHVPSALVHRIVEEQVSIDECIDRVLGERLTSQPAQIPRPCRRRRQTPAGSHVHQYPRIAQVTTNQGAAGAAFRRHLDREAGGNGGRLDVQ